MIPLDLAGVSRDEAPGKLEQREMNQDAILFDNVTVPCEFMIKGESHELEVARLLALSYTTLAAIIIGTARAAYEEALAHAKRREQGRARISDYQLVKERLFEMFTTVGACPERRWPIN